MRPAIRTTLLGAVGALCLAQGAFAQTYRGGDRYAPPPPPPPPPAGAVLPPDDGSVGPTTPNADGTYGYRPYISQPDTTPDDPGRFAYDAERDRRVFEARGYRQGDEDDAPPPYARRVYGARGYDGSAYASPPQPYPSYGNGYARSYDYARRPVAPAYVDRDDDDEDAPPPPPRYANPRYDGGYPTPPPYRGW